MSSPQVPKQSTRPLSPQSYLAAARKLRQYADDLERRANPVTPQDKRSLTRVIHSLAYATRCLRYRHDRLVVAPSSDPRVQVVAPAPSEA